MQYMELLTKPQLEATKFEDKCHRSIYGVFTREVLTNVWHAMALETRAWRLDPPNNASYQLQWPVQTGALDWRMAKRRK